jgi:peptide/nickel transport system substrate-binding protein/oligopeptide transport system substrate-binding protein
MLRHLKSFPALLALILIPLLHAGAAEGRSAEAVLATPAADAAPGELVVAFNSLEVEFDPHHSIYAAEAQVFTAIYEGLFTYDPSTLDPVKSACKTYQRSRDGLTYTFYIRDEASWSDGSPLRASDFRDAWLRALDPAQKADYASFFDVIEGAKDYRTGKTRDPLKVGVTVISDKVLQVKLAGPAAYFTRLLCHHSFSPIHPSMLKTRDWRSALPFPTNGPYLITSFKKGELILSKNSGYWDAASVAVPKLRILFTDDDAGVTRRFDDGEIQWLAGPMELKSLLDRGAIQVAPMFGTQYWYFDCRQTPWDKPDVRRALALLLPWKEIRSADSYYMPAETLVLPFSGYDKAKGIGDANIEEAKGLLVKAGFPGGKGLPTIVLLTPEGSDDAVRVSGIMKTEWEKLEGVKVEIKVVPSAAYFQSLKQAAGGGFTLGVQTWIGDFADPLAFLAMFAADSNLNDAHFVDKNYDDLLLAASGKDGDERLAALAEAETRLLQTGAVLPLYHNLAANVIDIDYVQGWYTNALDLHPFKYLAFGERSIRPNVALLF